MTWIAAAKRHPARSAVLAVVLLVVGLPVAWYLGSPLFIRTALEEPLPSAFASGVPSASAPTTTGAVVPTATALIEAPPSVPPATVTAGATSHPTRSGTFKGADDFHFGHGTASLIETSPGTWIVRFADFSVRNGPDLYVYLSPSAKGYDDAALELGTLKATDGSFNYKVPAGTDVSRFRSVVVWCKQFGVLFATAALS